MSKIDIAEKFSLFSDYWTPKVIAESNGQLVKLAKGRGELIWHKHDDEDEIFIVFKGKLTLQMRDGNVELLPGQMYVMPRGVEHCPIAEPDTEIILIEPASTTHTGDVVDAKVTVSAENQVWI